MQTVPQQTPCQRCPLQECVGLRPLEPRQLSYMEEFKAGEVFCPRGSLILEQGTATKSLYTVLDGVLIRFRTLEDGRRQIVNFMFPGDLVGLQGAFDEDSTHSVEALLDARLCVFTRSKFRELISQHPALGYDMTWLAAKEETALEEHIVALGQRNAKERVTYLAVWLLERALATGMAGKRNTLELPITQAQVADMLGLSLVHTNRTLMALGREELVIWKPGAVTIPDMEAAADFAHFDFEPGRPRPFI